MSKKKDVSIVLSEVECKNTIAGFIDSEKTEFDQWREQNPNASEDVFYDSDEDFNRKGYSFAAE